MITILCANCGSQVRAKTEHPKGTPCPNCGKPLTTSGVKKTPGAQPTTRESLETDTARPAELAFLAPAQEAGELGRLGDYRVLKILGQGAMGLVLLAEDMKLKRQVALKVMKKSQAKDAESRARFIREARAAAAIEHDHIVTIYQVDEDRGVPFIAMKLLVGETLEDRLEREGKLPPEEVIRIGQEVALGLAEAHERGLIHRDIKPANIWLEEGTGRVKILDFGLALADDSEAKLTQENYLVGTPMFMSPEQAEGDRELDPRSDLFSLGTVLYCCATGKVPFDGKNTIQVLSALSSKTPAPPDRVDADVPEALSTFIMKLLRKDPTDRPKSARLVVAALQEVRDAPTDYEEVEEEVEDDVVEEVEEEVAQPKERRPKKRRPKKPRREAETAEERLGRRVIWFGILAAVAIFILLAVLVVKRTFFPSP